MAVMMMMMMMKKSYNNDGYDIYNHDGCGGLDFDDDDDSGVGSV